MRALTKKARCLFCAVLAAAGPVLFCLPADAHIEKGYMPDAIADIEYRILLEFQPDDIKTRNKLGMVLYRLQKLDEAESEFRQVLNIDPDNFNAIDAMGLVRARQGKADQAIALFRTAIKIRPDDSLVYYHLGQSLEETGLTAEALAIYQTAAELIKKDLSTQADKDKIKILQSALADIESRTDKLSPAKPETAK